MKFILGKKLGMTRIFDKDGKSVAVSIVEAMPTFVHQIKTVDTDGYNAVAVKTVKKTEKKEKTLKICEFRTENTKKFKKDSELKASQFAEGDVISIEGTSKGKGFAGTIKRYGFHRGPETHGSNNVREPGSIGGGYPERVVKGRRMPGHMGTETVTIKNLKVMAIADNTLLISGAIPGPKKGLIKVYTPIKEEVKEESTEELKTEPLEGTKE